MFDFSDEHKTMRTMLRRWVEAELVPHIDALESEAMLPYVPMRNLIQTFGLADMARHRLAKARYRGRASSPAVCCCAWPEFPR